ncbi:MAG: soluble lytic murein transglycosylase-like protein [Kiritimatiellia bacterium]|jgi:soluble lytic murein transglycosylase-like protein
MLLWLSTLALGVVPANVADAVATGDCVSVDRLLAESEYHDARLVRAWCASRNDAHAKAVEILEPVKDGVLGEYGRLIRARSLLALDQNDAALRALDGLTLPGDAGLQVRLLRARAQINLKHSLDARPDLRLLLTTSVVDEARYMLARGALDRGEKDPAIATFRRVWIDSVVGGWSQLAAEQLQQLEQAVPDYDTGAGRDLVYKRIGALRKANQHKQVLAHVVQLQQRSPATTVNQKISLARSRFNGRDYPGAVAMYREILGEPAAASGGEELLFDYALGTSRTGDYDSAAVIYKRLVAQHPGSRRAHTAHYKLGYLEVDRDQCDKAIPLLKAHVEQRPSSPHVDEALWWIGRCHWRNERYGDAVKAWTQLQQTKPRSSMNAGGTYWIARAMGKRGDAAGEVTGLKGVLSRYPTSGYAWFAAYRLGRTFPAKPLATRPAWPKTLAGRTDVQRSDQLSSLGFKTWARHELAPLARYRSASREEAMALAWAFIDVGDYRVGKSKAKGYCRQPWRQGGLPDAQQACTPQIEGRIVSQVAARYQLNQLVPYGIMITESALDPSVTSIAGARGLMQLMPKEAATIHTEAYGDRPYHADMLYSAPYNASMGTTELGLKMRALDGVLEGTSLPAAVAAYNGGEEAVRRWIALHEGKPEFDEFTEDIGYTETRRYVKKVLGHTMAYRWTYGDPVASDE